MAKFRILIIFGLTAAMTQYLALNFAPVLSLVQAKYQVTETVASLLILVFPLVFVLLSIPVGSLIDNYGYSFSIKLGAAIMAFFSCLRCFDDSFYVVLVAQTGMAVAQPFVINAISKLVMDWFDPQQSAMATGLGTMGMFIGMAAGLGLTPWVVSISSYHSMNIYSAGSSLFLLVLCFFGMKSHPSPQTQGDEEKLSLLGELKFLFSKRDLVLLLLLSFLGLGFFNGLTTWIELILAPNGISSVQAGMVGSFFIFGGIFGAASIPALSDKTKRRKPFLVGGGVISFALIYPFCRGAIYDVLLLESFVLGFFFLPAFSIALEMCADLAGSKRAGAATSLLLLAGNLGGVVVIPAMDWVNGGDKSFRAGGNVLVILLLAFSAISLLLKETYRAKTPSQL